MTITLKSHPWRTIPFFLLREILVPQFEMIRLFCTDHHGRGQQRTKSQQGNWGYGKGNTAAFMPSDSDGAEGET